jgi:hypothetical protein
LLRCCVVAFLRFFAVLLRCCVALLCCITVLLCCCVVFLPLLRPVLVLYNRRFNDPLVDHSEGLMSPPAIVRSDLDKAKVRPLDRL